MGKYMGVDRDLVGLTINIEHADLTTKKLNSTHIISINFM